MLAHVLNPYAPPVVATVLSLLIVAIIGYLTVKAYRKTTSPVDPLWEYSILIVLMLIISPVTEPHHFVLVAPAYLYILTKSASKREFYLFGAAFLLIQIRFSVARFAIFDEGILFVFRALPLWGASLMFRMLLGGARKKVGQLSCPE